MRGTNWPAATSMMHDTGRAPMQVTKVVASNQD